TKESTELLHKTNLLAEDIQKKSEDLNTVVYAVRDVGHSIQNLNTSVKKVSTNISSELERNQGRISQVVQWGNTLMELRGKWKERKAVEQPPVPATDDIGAREKMIKRARSYN
ncbi:DUF948 domain-containing protein, partial [Rossellomorea marisflavi]